MLDGDEINVRIGSFAEEVVKIARRNLKIKSTTNFRGERWKTTKKPRRIEASGKTGRSLGYQLRVLQNSYELKFEGAETTQYTEYGRGPGGRPPLQRIMQWVKDKNVKPYVTTPSGGRKFVSRSPRRLRMMAYAIAKKIGERGTQPTYFYEAAVNEALEKHLSIVEDGLITDIETTSENILKKLRDGFS